MNELRRFTEAQQQCTYCPRLCRYACPVETASGREALTPKHKMQTALELRAAKAHIGADTAAIFWGCSDCGACEDACLHGNPVGAALYAARALAVRAGLQPAALAHVARQAALPIPTAWLQPIDPATHAQVATGALMRADVALVVDDEAIAAAAFTTARRINAGAALGMVWNASGVQALRSPRILREAGETAAYDRSCSVLADALSHCREWWVADPAELDDYEAIAEHLSPAPRVRALIAVMAEASLDPNRRFRSVAVQWGCAIRRRPALEEAIGILAHRLSDEVRLPALDLPFSGCCGGRGLIAEVHPDVAADMGSGRSAELAELKAEATLTFSRTCHKALPGTLQVIPLFAPEW